MPQRDRTLQLLLIGTFVPFCWLGFQVCHELGHVLGAWLTGGTVTQVVLHPFTISRTEVDPNPAVAVEVWAGPLVGVALPWAFWGLVQRLRFPRAFLARFFAGFCAIANGAYLALGSLDGIGDAGELLHHGTPRWALWLFGAVTIPVGFLAWHRLGPQFGLGAAGGVVDRWAVVWSCELFAATFLLMLFTSPWA